MCITGIKSRNTILKFISSGTSVILLLMLIIELSSGRKYVAVVFKLIKLCIYVLIFFTFDFFIVYYKNH